MMKEDKVEFIKVVITINVIATFKDSKKIFKQNVYMAKTFCYNKTKIRTKEKNVMEKKEVIEKIKKIKGVKVKKRIVIVVSIILAIILVMAVCVITDKNNRNIWW